MALGFPQPPTDSLYKFLALSGLLLCTASVYLPGELATRLEERDLQLQTKVAVVRTRADQALDRVEEIGKFIDHAIAKQQGSYKPDPSRLQLAFAEVELKALLDRQHDITAEIATSVEEVKGLAREVTYLEDRRRRLERIGLLGSWGGGAVALVGFALWYVRIQRHEDRVSRRRGAGLSDA